MRPFLASVLLFVALPLHGQSTADSVFLRFDWPVGMTACVEADWSRVQVTAQQRDSSHFRSTYRMLVGAHPAGRLISIDSFEVRPLTVTSNGAPLRVPSDSATYQAQQLLQRIGSFMPSYVVSDSGDFVAIADIERIRAAVDDFLNPLLQQISDAPEQLRVMFSNLTSSESLTASAAQEWNLVAGTWVGAEWEVGERYEASAREPIPAFPGHEVDMHYEFSAVERVPCTGDDLARSCILLEMWSEPDSASLQGAMREFMSSVLASAGSAVPAMQITRLTNEVTVVADPRTLRPYFVEHAKLIDITTSASGREPGVQSTRVDIRSARYRY